MEKQSQIISEFNDISYKKGVKVLKLSFPCVFAFIYVLAFSLKVEAKTIIDSDTTQVNKLKEVEVIAEKDKIRRFEDGKIRVDFSELNSGIRVLGEPDLLLALKTMPGIASVGDYGSGLMVDGTESSQTLFRIDGAPVFFPYRFGGVFSTFNGVHFISSDFQRNIHDASMPLRVGGLVDVNSYKNNDGFSGIGNFGLLSSSVGLRYGDGHKWCVSGAARLSYPFMDMIYGTILKTKDTDLAYNFSDINLSASYRIGSSDYLSAGFFFSVDKLSFEGGKYEMDSKIDWHNEVASIGWKHLPVDEEKLSVVSTVYYSGFNSSLGLSMPVFSIHAPSSIKNFGFNTKFSQSIFSQSNIKTTYGLDGDLFIACPQWCRLIGYGEPVSGKIIKQRFGAVTLFGDIIYKPKSHWEFTGGLSMTDYINGSYSRFIADPRITVARIDSFQRISLHGGIYHQYLHQTGFSDIGLASNFWSGATKSNGITASYNLVAAWFRQFPGLFDVNLEIYYKKIYNSAEYEGVALDLVDNNYDALSRIVMAHGYNYGINIEFSGKYGKSTVRVGYGYGDGLRRLGDEKMWRSRTSLGHSVKAFADYRLGKHWSVCASFTYASGRPYTPIKSIYLIAGNIMTDYGVRNSARMPDYQRLDLSCNYIIHTNKKIPLTHILNISLLNAYGHKNIEMQYFRISKDTSRLKMARIGSIYRFFPSISYTIKI